MYAAELSCEADVDQTVTFVHKGLGVVVGEGVVIGGGTRVLQNVTLGGRGSATRNGRSKPVIGRNVLVGAGACILGPVTVGDGARVGANAVVIVDIPAGCTAVGVPARLIRPYESDASSPDDENSVLYERDVLVSEGIDIGSET